MEVVRGTVGRRVFHSSYPYRHPDRDDYHPHLYPLPDVPPASDRHHKVVSHDDPHDLDLDPYPTDLDRNHPLVRLHDDNRLRIV